MPALSDGGGIFSGGLGRVILLFPLAVSRDTIPTKVVNRLRMVLATIYIVSDSAHLYLSKAYTQHVLTKLECWVAHFSALLPKFLRVHSNPSCRFSRVC